ncbi:hypothetical protein LJY18_12040 [Pseudomonas sp. MMS21-TM103]|uniref:hypothetical protein n=1 Tax=Pseudomonas sp. MMS21 TM103 TaxID=2886506 RepID=UPI001EDFFF55|nr:hypothetical protein [Pseudomonas sp. MMS21 TM103]MCG4454027.1 hypothetical protein [Pseudomonas sp. MMS21 TM103]
MSFNLANKSSEQRNIEEAEKARLFELWQQNLHRTKVEAARLVGEKSKRKGKWDEWLRAQLAQLAQMTPPEYASMVQREVRRLLAAR